MRLSFFCITKALEGLFPEGFIVHSFFASLILSDFAMNIY